MDAWLAGLDGKREFEHFFRQEGDNEFTRPLGILTQYWRWMSYGSDFLPDRDAPGSYLTYYWWDVIHGMRMKWENEKHEGNKRATPGDPKKGSSRGDRFAGAKKGLSKFTGGNR